VAPPKDEPGDSGAFLALLEQRAPRPLAIQEMARMLSLERYDRKPIKMALESAVASHRLRRVGKTRYQWIRDFERAPQVAREGAALSRRGTVRVGASPMTERGVRSGRSSSRGRVEGRYSRVRAGYGFVEVLGRAAERFARDILIPAGMEGAALHGDRVEVEIIRRDPRLRRTVGQITAVTGAARPRANPAAEETDPSIPLAPRFEPTRISGFAIRPNISKSRTGMLLPR